MTAPGVVVVLVARVPAGGRASFLEYEAAVVPLLAEHRARLERRLRSEDGRVEVHVVWFPSPVALAAYRADPRRAAARPLLDASGAAVEAIELADAAVEELLGGSPARKP
jgi:hypothetical protein